MAATRNLFERPELLDNQTRLILSADAKPKRLIRSASRSAGHHLGRDRSDSAATNSVIEETEDDDDEVLNDDATELNTSAEQRPRKNSTGAEEVDYDTDLEQEPEPGRDYTCRALYLDQCRRHGVIASTHFLRNINHETLTIRYCGLKPISVKVMVPALKMNSTITKLDLRDNGLGSRGAIYIAQILKDNEYIDELNLGDNDIGTKGCQALCRVLCANRSIRILNLDGNRFNDDCAQAVAEVFSQNEHITHINLNKNFFENEMTGRLLGQALGENQSLEEVHLAWNRLNSKACGQLLKPLGTNARLTVLDLSWNGARLLAAKAIADVLKKNTVLEKLYLTNNQFDTECATHIGKGLAKNTALKILTLNGNPLESSGCYAVVRPLIKYPASPLQVVDLRGIIVNRDFLDLVTELAGVLPLLSIRLGREREREVD